MTTPLTWLDDWIAAEPTQEAIPLDLALLDLSHRPTQERWAYRLQQLAVQGFEHWLQEREPSLSLNPVDGFAGLTVALEVGSFRVCLMPTSLTDDEVAIPQSAVKQPSSAAHFYVAIAIDEEAEVASLVGFLPYDQLVARCANISPDTDQTYPLPTAALNSNLNALLLFLQFLSVDAIPLPAATSTRLAERSPLIEIIRQPLTNASRWLQRQADGLSTHDDWQMIPAAALRWETSSIRDQLTELLQHNSLPQIPIEAGVAYQSITLVGCTLRLFAAVWPWPDASGDWTLLAMVSPVPGQSFPAGLSLVIDEITPGSPPVELAHEMLAAEQSRSALFTQVKGDRHDVFDIVLTAADSEQPWSAAVQFRPEE